MKDGVLIFLVIQQNQREQQLVVAFPNKTLTGFTGCFRMGFKDKVLILKIIGCAFKEHSTLGNGYHENERMNLNVIFRFILSILKHPVNPVFV